MNPMFLQALIAQMKAKRDAQQQGAGNNALQQGLQQAFNPSQAMVNAGPLRSDLLQKGAPPFDPAYWAAATAPPPQPQTASGGGK